MSIDLQGIYSQPLHKLLGFEALTRVPDVTDIESYIKSLEKNGRIEEHDLHVLEVVCSKMSHYRNRLNGFFVGVNLSLHTLSNPYAADKINKVIKRHGLRRENIAFEITETAEGLTDENWKSICFNLLDLGRYDHPLLLDDFPMGDPKRQQLIGIVDIIKLDKSFIPNGLYENAVMRRLAGKTGHIVIEGAENPHHHALTMLTGKFQAVAVSVQGNNFGHPEPIDRVLLRLPITESWLAAQFKKLAQEGRTFLGERRGVGMGNLGPMVAG